LILPDQAISASWLVREIRKSTLWLLGGLIDGGEMLAKPFEVLVNCSASA
jgi:hypothetical protein